MPLLVIVSGPPATGKTTLGRKLACALGLFMLGKDDIKEHLGDVLPARSLADSKALGAAAYELLFHLVGDALESDISVLMETPLYREFHDQQVQDLVSRARALCIHCYAPQEVAATRFRQRYDRGERHLVHFDAEQPFITGAVSDAEWDRRACPLDLSIPTLVLDTANGYLDDLDPVLRFIRSAGNEPEPACK